VKHIISYIIKYQNNYISSYLFLKNFPILLSKGIPVEDLIKSKIFSVTFDFNDWPTNHTNLENCIRPYNGSFFEIRYKYRDIFFEDSFKEVEAFKCNHDGKIDSRKIYKIKYSVNLLPQIGQCMNEKGEFINEDIPLMELCSNAEELEVFESEALMQLIHYKWNKFGKNHHLIGCIMHFFNTFIIITYIILSYY